MRNIKAEAERLRIGLRGGWRTIAEIVAWADDILISEPSPPPQIIDLSLSRMSHPVDVAYLLDDIPGMIDRVAIMRECLVDLRRWMGDDGDRGEQAAESLYILANVGMLPETEFGEGPLGFHDMFYLAKAGVYGTVLDALNYLKDWLDTNGMQGEAK
jgi:hypothetical protein